MPIFHALSARELLKAIGVGLVVSVLTAAFMIAAAKSGLSPLPKPLGLAFAKTILGPTAPLPVGLAFHAAWVTAFSVIFISLFRNGLTFLRALLFAAALWVVVLVVFFPVVGWGFFGLAINPKLIVGAAIPHLLFAILLWGFARLAFKS